jgi:hypothetical protein
VMTNDVKRFQSFGDSPQVYDFFCFHPLKSYPNITDIECRCIPVVDGFFSVGSIYSGLFGSGWRPSSLYSYSGRWSTGYTYSSRHVGFPFIVACLVVLPFFITGVRRWRRHESRLQHGLCVKCEDDVAGASLLS